VLDGANELRVMLCRDKMVQSSSGQKRGTSVIAACGASRKGSSRHQQQQHNRDAVWHNTLTGPALAVSSTTA
jgi:hypothetical protein